MPPGENPYQSPGQGPPKRALLSSGFFRGVLVGCGVPVLLALSFFVALAVSAYKNRVTDEELREATDLSDAFYTCFLKEKRDCLREMTRWDDETIEDAVAYSEEQYEKIGIRTHREFHSSQMTVDHASSFQTGRRQVYLKIFLQSAYERSDHITESFEFHIDGDDIRISRYSYTER